MFNKSIFKKQNETKQNIYLRKNVLKANKFSPLLCLFLSASFFSKLEMFNCL